MTAPDLGLARRFLAKRPVPGSPMLLAVTGSHHYGFDSPDSDLDLKGIHLAPTRALLGMSRPAETHDVLEVFEGTECDLTSHELGKALALLLRGNGNVLERIFSPHQVVDGPHVATLRDLARRNLSRRVHDHYGGYFRGMSREHARESPPGAKSLLYSFRVALTGAHLLRTGEVVAHLPTLAPLYGFASILEAVEAKATSHEKASLEPAVAERHRTRWPELEALLEESLNDSPLPDEPEAQEALGEWLVEQRMTQLRG